MSFSFISLYISWTTTGKRTGPEIESSRAGARARAPDSPTPHPYGCMVYCAARQPMGGEWVLRRCVCVVVFVVFVVKNVRTMGPVLGQCAICSEPSGRRTRARKRS